MGRRKLELGLIKSKKNRARTFINRKNGIMKKAYELSLLCNVDIGVIIFGPNGENPHVWPQEPQKLTTLLQRYQSTSKDERQKRAKSLLSPSSKEKVAQNFDFDPTLDDQIGSFSAEKLVELINCLDVKLGFVQERINMMRESSQKSMQFVQDDNNVQFSGSEEQGQMMMMMMNNMGLQQPSSFQWGCENQPDDHQYVGFDDELMSAMMMMNGGGCFNPTDAGMGDCIGFMQQQEGNCNHDNQDYNFGRRENVDGGGMWNPCLLTCYNDPMARLQQQQLQLDQQFNAGQNQMPSSDECFKI